MTASDSSFFEASVRFVTDATVTLALFSQLPKLLYRPVSYLTMNSPHGRSKMKALLAIEVIQRKGQAHDSNEIHVGKWQSRHIEVVVKFLSARLPAMGNGHIGRKIRGLHCQTNAIIDSWRSASATYGRWEALYSF
jgi:hypothetical protein